MSTYFYAAEEDTHAIAHAARQMSAYLHVVQEEVEFVGVLGLEELPLRIGKQLILFARRATRNAALQLCAERPQTMVSMAIKKTNEQLIV